MSFVQAYIIDKYVFIQAYIIDKYVFVQAYIIDKYVFVQAYIIDKYVFVQAYIIDKYVFVQAYIIDKYVFVQAYIIDKYVFCSSIYFLFVVSFFFVAEPPDSQNSPHAKSSLPYSSWKLTLLQHTRKQSGDPFVLGMNNSVSDISVKGVVDHGSWRQSTP